MTTNATRRARQHKIIAEHERTIAALRQQLDGAERLLRFHGVALAPAAQGESAGKRTKRYATPDGKAPAPSAGETRAAIIAECVKAIRTCADSYGDGSTLYLSALKDAEQEVRALAAAPAPSAGETPNG